MLLAQGRYWRVTARRGGESLSLTLLKEALGEDPPEIRDPKVEVPLTRWNGVVKHVRSDRKLLGGILLDFARSQEHLAGALADDRLYGELRRVALDATVALVEEGLLVLAPPPSEEE